MIIGFRGKGYLDVLISKILIIEIKIKISKILTGSAGSVGSVRKYANGSFPSIIAFDSVSLNPNRLERSCAVVRFPGGSGGESSSILMTSLLPSGPSCV